MNSSMKSYSLQVLAPFLLLLSSALPGHAQSLHADFMQAVDERRNDPALLAQAFENWDNRALRLWGLLGAGACEAIRPYLASTDDVTSNALQGLANCRDTASYNKIAAIARTGEFFGVRYWALTALAFTSAEENLADHVALVTDVLNSDKSDDEKAAGLYGLMQSITYSGLTPADLPDLDMNLLLDLARKPGKLGFEAAYLLIRLQGLEAAMSASDVASALAVDLPTGQAFLLARLLGQLGNAASAPLLSLAANHASADLADRRVAVSALRALGGLSDPTSRTFLLRLLLDAAPEFKQLALAALDARSDADAIVQQRLWNFVDNQNAWLAVTALEGLAMQGDAKALDTAADWLAKGSFYKAFRAVSMLAGSDEGRSRLQAYLDAASDPVRVRIVKATLDPDSVPAAPVRPTVPYVEAVASDGGLITLETTRGDIVIELIEGTPYAGHNFLSLARDGAMDGMIWHRVIPGFVAQAGQIDNMQHFTHGTIREEWGAMSHEPGTVGVATAGPDTGSSQFFINLEHNRHLDGRYTVFGRVVSGMDVAYSLKEGDEIIKAK